MSRKLTRFLGVMLLALLSAQASAQFDNTYEHAISDDHTALVKSISGGGFIQASTTQGATKDIHLMKLDQAGNVIVDVILFSSGGDEVALDVARGNGHTYLICGYENIGGLDLGFVLQVDTVFNILGKVNIQVPANNRHTPALNIINSAFYDTPSFGTYFPGDVNGGYLVTGFEAVGYSATASKSGYAIKLSNSLTVQWARKFDSPISLGTPDWDMCSTGNWLWAGTLGYMVGGSGTAPTGEQSGLAACLDLNGNVLWSKLYSDSNAPGTHCVVADGAYDDQAIEVYQLTNYSQTQSGGIVAFNQNTGVINMARTRYLIANTPRYYSYEFAATCGSSAILISGYGLNQTAGSITGTFPYTIMYNKDSPMVSTGGWQHFAYPLQSSNYTPSATIFDTYGTPNQPRIYYPKMFASRTVNTMTMAGFEDNLTFNENAIVNPYFDGKDSCDFVDPQIIAVQQPMFEWSVNNVLTSYVLPPSTFSSVPTVAVVQTCFTCTVDPTFTITTGPGCIYTFTANNPSNLCAQFTLTDVSNNVLFSGFVTSFNFNFLLNGTYTVCYSDCAPDGTGALCRDVSCQTFIVNCPPPCPVDADFNWTVTGCCVLFSDLTPEGNPFGCESWVFGTISSVLAGDNVSFCFPSSGTYTVCHYDCCIDAFGVATYDMKCYSITVSCTPPCCLPTGINVTAVGCCINVSLIQPNIPPCIALAYVWNFGDGNLAYTPNATHCYAGKGIYTVCLTAYCNKTSKVQFCKKIKVVCTLPPPPPGGGGTAKIGFSTSGTMATFTNWTPASTAVNVTSSAWSFGDGTGSTATNPAHLYAIGGSYDVTLTVQGTYLGTGEPFSDSHIERITVIKNPTCGCAPPWTSAFASNPSVCQSTNAVSLHLIDLDGEADVTHQWMKIDACCSVSDDDFSSWQEIPGAIGQLVWVQGVSASTSYRCRSRSNITGLTTWSDIVAVQYGHMVASMTASPPDICPGISSTLTVSSPGALLYEWEPDVSASSSAVVSPPSTTTYEVVVENDLSCGASASRTVTVAPCVGPPNNPRAGALAIAPYPINTCISQNGDLTLATVSPEANSLVNTGEDLWHRFVANSPGVRIVCTTTAFDAVIELQDAAGNTIAQENALSGIGSEMLNHYDPLNPLIIGQTYYFAIRNYDSSLGTGTFSVCVQRIRATACNSGTGPYSLCDNFKAMNVGAQSYTFVFTDTGTGEQFTQTSSSGITITPLGALRPQQQYLCGLTAHFSLSIGSGGSEQISVSTPAACTITMAAHLNVELRDADRCTAGPKPANAIIGANRWICGASNYQWRFKQTAPTLAADYGTPVSGPPTNRFLNLAPLALTPGATYDVQIRPVFSGGQVGSWSSVPRCLQILGSAGMVVENSTPQNELSSNSAGAAPHVVIYPNPTSGDWVQLVVNHWASDRMNILVRDAVGRVVCRQQWTMDEHQSGTLVFGQQLSAGLYFVEVSDDTNRQTLPLIIQR